MNAATSKTDAQMQADVEAELTWDPSIKAEGIKVKVKDGVATLTDQLATFSDKWNAGRAAQRVSGVKSVKSDIKVAVPKSDRRDDTDISRTAEIALYWMAGLPKDSIKVKVDQGMLSLDGEVDWAYQLDAASTAVSRLQGVCGISNNLAIRPRACLLTVQADIEAALKRCAMTGAKKIDVAVVGSEVTLSGKVASWSERELAEHAAWGAAGVRKVVDNITVAA